MFPIGRGCALTGRQVYIAWDLKKAYGDKLELRVIDDGGHSPTEPSMLQAVTEVGPFLFVMSAVLIPLAQAMDSLRDM